MIALNEKTGARVYWTGKTWKAVQTAKNAETGASAWFNPDSGVWVHQEPEKPVSAPTVAPAPKKEPDKDPPKGFAVVESSTKAVEYLAANLVELQRVVKSTAEMAGKERPAPVLSIPEYPDPPRAWTFEIERDRDGWMTEIRARAG